MDYEEDDSTYIPPESELGRLIDSLPDDERKSNIINYYYKNNEYLKGLSRSMKMLDYFISHKEKAYNVVKTTRAGFTTNCILSALIKNKKILLVAPTNKILYDTVLNSYNLYVKITGDFKKYIRPIPNNRDGCSCVMNKIKSYPQLNILPYISSEDCATCTKYNNFKLSLPKLPISSTYSHCIIKTMLSEQEYSPEYSPDVLTITYDKFATLGKNKKSLLFKELISKVDIIVFDEIGEYLSKSYQGFEIFKESEYEKFDDKHITSILISHIPLIKNPSSKKVIFHLYGEYIIPFLSFLSKNYSGNFPRLEINPLTQIITETDVPVTPTITRDMIINKQMALQKKYREYYNTIESLLIDNESSELILLLINLLNLMTKKQLLFYDLNTAKYYPKYNKIKSIYISSAKDEIIENLINWSQDNNKIIIFSDATMPAHNLHGYNARKVKNIFYGDPASNNKSSLIFHDTSISQFSKYAYFNRYNYREILISRLIELLKLNYYGNEVIWTSSKDIASDISSILNVNGIPTCTHNNPESHSVMITYYGSTFTRGVESSRRYQILIGKSIKPQNSFKHIAYMRRNSWNIISEKDLNYLSSKESIPITVYQNLIKNWSNTVSLNDYIIMDNKIPPKLNNYFEHLSSSIQKEKIYMDSWQAASRVKDPISETRSINICLGWTLNEIYEMIKWGTNESISYSPISSSRILKTQRNLIPQPYVVSSDDITQISSWINNQEIKPINIGFNENIIEGIRNIVKENKEATLEDVWIALCKNNIEFNNNTDTHNNGYLIGAINSAILYNIGDDIEITPDYIFKYNPFTKPKPKSYTIRRSEFLNILEVLRSIYLINSEIVSYRDVRHFISPKKIPNSILKEIWEIIIDNNIFVSSTWIIEGKKIRKTTSEKLEYENLKDLMSLRLKPYPNAHEVCKYILEWYYNEKTLYETNLNILSDSIPRFYHNLPALKDITETLLNSDEWKEFNIPCDIEKTSDGNIIFTRSSIVY